MAYKNWNRKKIKSQVKYLRERYEHTKDERFLVDAKYLVSLLEGAINIFDLPCSLKEQLESDAISIDTYYDFLDDIKEFARVNGPKFNERTIYEVDPIGNLSPSLLFSFMREFFYEFDIEFGKLYDEIYKERFNNLKFSDDRSISFYLPSLEYSYLNITKLDTVDDFLNSVHEYTHAIVDRMFYRLSGGSYPFCELVSMFLELLAADYMRDVYVGLDDDLNEILLSGANKITVYAENISIEDSYLRCSEASNNHKMVISGMANISGKSNNYVRRLLEKTAEEKFTYAIPYLTAVELFYLYKQDKQQCVDLIKYLIYVENIENYNLDLNDHGIVLNTHSSQWIDNLLNYKKGLK